MLFSLFLTCCATLAVSDTPASPVEVEGANTSKAPTEKISGLKLQKLRLSLKGSNKKREVEASELPRHLKVKTTAGGSSTAVPQQPAAQQKHQATAAGSKAEQDAVLSAPLQGAAATNGRTADKGPGGSSSSLLGKVPQVGVSSAKQQGDNSTAEGSQQPTKYKQRKRKPTPPLVATEFDPVPDLFKSDTLKKEAAAAAKKTLPTVFPPPQKKPRGAAAAAGGKSKAKTAAAAAEEKSKAAAEENAKLAAALAAAEEKVKVAEAAAAAAEEKAKAAAAAEEKTKAAAAAVAAEKTKAETPAQQQERDSSEEAEDPEEYLVTHAGALSPVHNSEEKEQLSFGDDTDSVEDTPTPTAPRSVSPEPQAAPAAVAVPAQAAAVAVPAQAAAAPEDSPRRAVTPGSDILTSDLAALQEKYEKLNAQVAELTAVKEALTFDYSSLKKDYCDLFTQSEQQKETIKEKQRDCNKSEKELAAVQQQLKLTKNSFTATLSDLTDLRKEAKSTEAKYSDILSQYQGLKKLSKEDAARRDEQQLKREKKFKAQIAEAEQRTVIERAGLEKHWNIHFLKQAAQYKREIDEKTLIHNGKVEDLKLQLHKANRRYGEEVRARKAFTAKQDDPPCTRDHKTGNPYRYAPYFLYPHIPKDSPLLKDLVKSEHPTVKDHYCMFVGEVLAGAGHIY